MVRRRVVGLLAGGLLALATALIAVSGSALANGAAYPNVALDTTGGTTGHQSFPIAWDATGYSGDCGSFAPGPGEVTWHFILTSPSTSPNPAHLYAWFQTAGMVGPTDENPPRGGSVEWYVITPTHDTLLGIWSDNEGNQLNLSHICVGTDPSQSPSIPVETETPFESIGGETGTPEVSDTPYESIEGETGTPAASHTTPPTSTASGILPSGATPLMAMLICLAFGSLGLLAVEVQRRKLHR